MGLGSLFGSGGGGLSPNRLSAPLSTGMSQSPKMGGQTSNNSFLSRFSGRSKEFLKAKMSYEHMKSLGSAGRGIQMVSYSKMKEIEDLEKKKKEEEKQNDLYKR